MTGLPARRYGYVADRFVPLAQKYKRMEEALQWVAEKGNPNSKQLLVVNQALAFDPLAE